MPIDWTNPSPDVVEARRIGCQDAEAQAAERIGELEEENARLKETVAHAQQLLRRKSGWWVCQCCEKQFGPDVPNLGDNIDLCPDCAKAAQENPPPCDKCDEEGWRTDGNAGGHSGVCHYPCSCPKGRALDRRLVAEAKAAKEHHHA